MPFDKAKMRQRRDKLGISREKLGRQLDVSGGTVYHWETGQRTPTLDHIDRIAAALGIKAHELVREKT